MKYNIHIISDAEKDLFEIYDYIKKAGYPQNADTIFSEIETLAASAENPRPLEIDFDLTVFSPHRVLTYFCVSVSFVAKNMICALFAKIVFLMSLFP